MKSTKDIKRQSLHSAFFLRKKELHFQSLTLFMFLQTLGSRYKDGWFWSEINKSGCRLLEQGPELSKKLYSMSLHKIKFSCGPNYLLLPCMIHHRWIYCLVQTLWALPQQTVISWASTFIKSCHIAYFLSTAIKHWAQAIQEGFYLAHGIRDDSLLMMCKAWQNFWATGACDWGKETKQETGNPRLEPSAGVIFSRHAVIYF